LGIFEDNTREEKLIEVDSPKLHDVNFMEHPHDDMLTRKCSDAHTISRD
jgi:hypothetical protein